MTELGTEKLQKMLARAGLGSRRTCETMIAAGRVTVNGLSAPIGLRVDADRDRVEVDGIPVVVDSALVYWLLNKPAGVLTTAHDPHGRRTVLDLVPDTPRVFPVGRLDYATEGLLVLTNDGELAQLMSHPRHGVEKEYLADVAGHPTAAAIRRLRDGVDLDDGVTAPARVRVVQQGPDKAAIALTLHEGRNRQVRRMCDAVGYPLLRLVRTRIGPIADRRLRPGAWRALTPAEVRALYGAALGRPISGRGPSRTRG